MPKCNAAVQYNLFEVREAKPRKARSPQLTVTLKDHHEGESIPLDVLVDRALNVLNHRESKIITAQWLLRHALRAVCEAAIEDHCLTMPLRIHRPYKLPPRPPRLLPPPRRQNVSATLDAEQYASLAQIAAVERRSTASVIRDATRSFVKHLADAGKEGA